MQAGLNSKQVSLRPARLWPIASYSSTFGSISGAKGNSFYERIKIFAIFIVELTTKKDISMRLYLIIATLLVVPLCQSCDSLSASFALLRQGFDKSSTQVGGYTEPRKLTDSEAALFEKYVAKIADVEYEPINVATQIVAGTNYRFLCKGREVKADGKRGKKFYATIILHRPLPDRGEPRIISIERKKR